MRFMIMVRANAASEAGVMPKPEDGLMEEMVAFHEEMARAGVLLDGAGLKPSSRGWRIRYEGGQRRVIDGPFTEAKELIAGYTLIQVRSREEAMAWARRFPDPFRGVCDGGEIEVRELYEMEDFEDQASAGRFRDITADKT